MARTKQTARRQLATKVARHHQFTPTQQLNAAAAYRDFHKLTTTSLHHVQFNAMGFGGWARDFIRIVRKTLVLSPLFQQLPYGVIGYIFEHIQESLPADPKFD